MIATHKRDVSIVSQIFTIFIYKYFDSFWSLFAIPVTFDIKRAYSETCSNVLNALLSFWLNFTLNLVTLTNVQSERRSLRCNMRKNGNKFSQKRISESPWELFPFKFNSLDFERNVSCFRNFKDSSLFDVWGAPRAMCAVTRGSRKYWSNRKTKHIRTPTASRVMTRDRCFLMRKHVSLEVVYERMNILQNKNSPIWDRWEALYDFWPDYKYSWAHFEISQVLLRRAAQTLLGTMRKPFIGRRYR